ncbi:MAG: hypothetical protein HC937_03180 [Aquincola sp.]|nr:hypothetical protein [Aquincola sp.]
MAAPTDDVYIDAGSVSATLATSSGGGFEAVSLSTTPAVTTITDTLDTTTATLTAIVVATHTRALKLPGIARVF